MPASAVQAAQPVGYIGGGVEMRKERGLLRDQRGEAMAGRKPQAAFGVRERIAVECDAAVRRFVAASAIQTGEKAKQRAFACAGVAEDHCPVGGETALHLEMEAAAVRI